MILYTDGTTTQAVNYAPPASTSTNLAGGTANAIPYQTGPDTTTFLPSVSGDAGKVLTSNGTSAPSWSTVSGTASSITGGSAGRVLYQSGTNTTDFTDLGTSNYLLQSNGTAKPTWTTNLSLTSAAFSGAVSAATYYVGNASNYINQSSNEIGFVTGGTQASKFTSSGLGTYNVIATGGIGCGNVAPGNQNLKVKGTFSSQAAAFIESYSGGSTGLGINCVGGSIYAILFQYDGVNVGGITVNPTNTAYNTASDRRLKTDIAPLTNAGSVIDALQPRTFKWNATKKSAKGFIADEFQQVVPDAVIGEPNAIDEKGNPKYQMVDAATPEMIALMVAELQSLRKRVAALEAKT
jgi:hypothetical protein